jgi:hypothetical protein
MFDGESGWDASRLVLYLKWCSTELHACKLGARPPGGVVSRRSPFLIELSDDDRRCLEVLARKHTAERRQVLRARIVLAVAGGEENARRCGRPVGGIRSPSPRRLRSHRRLIRVLPGRTMGRQQRSQDGR